MIQVFRPSITQREIDAVTEVLKSGWLGLGPRTAEFEREFAKFVGAKHAVATNSATAALHLALMCCDIGPGDEVLVPTITFVSTAHAVRYCGARPVFCDVEPDTLCIDVEDARGRVTERTKAVMPVHYAGHPCDMRAVFDLAAEFGLDIVDDAAHACGSRHKGWRIGGEPLPITVFSFHAVKNLTCGEGGMLVTNADDIAERARRLRWCGIDKSTWRRTEEGSERYAWYYEVPELGYKYHGNDITSAIGLVQLERLSRLNARRRYIVAHYNQGLADLDWLELPVEKRGMVSSWHAYVVKTEHRDRLNEWLRERGVATGVHYVPIHMQPYYHDWEQPKLPVAERVWKTLLTLPLYPDMSDDDVSTVIAGIREFEP
jgi:perosamine synthetase